MEKAHKWAAADSSICSLSPAEGLDQISEAIVEKMTALESGFYDIIAW